MMMMIWLYPFNVLKKQTSLKTILVLIPFTIMVFPYKLAKNCLTVDDIFTLNNS